MLTVISLLVGVPNVHLQVVYYSTQVLNGLFLGVVLALAAIGLSLVFGIMKIINFAHGDILTVGAFAGFEINRLTGSFLLAIPVGIVVTAALGALIEITLLRRLYLRENAQLEMVTLTFGLAFILRELIIINWGSDGKFLELPAWLSGNLNLGFTSYPRYRALMIIATVAIISGVYLSLTRTKIGMMIIAGSKDREMARMTGINMKRLGTIGFALGAGLAGLAGIIIAPVRNVYPLMGFDILLPAFVIVLIGGMGSIVGTAIAALIIGQIITFTSLVAAPMSDIIVFIVMAVVLIVRSDALDIRGGTT